VNIRPLVDADEAWAGAFLDDRMGGRHQARRGELLDALAFPGFVAEIADAPSGLVTYRDEGDEWELFCIVVHPPAEGTGTALVNALMDAARARGIRRIWLVTTNDNQRALRFYQRRGFRLCGLTPDGVAASRAVKPTIPVIGQDGIPVRDELELELDVSALPPPSP
jgi:ribosomal protein S18 acetylase RimI-like enzyme